MQPSNASPTLGAFAGKGSPVQPERVRPAFRSVSIRHDLREFRVTDTTQYDEPTFNVRQLSVVGLGLVRTRTMWPPRDSKTRRPLCASQDAVTGTPGIDFPWDNRHLDGLGLGPFVPETIACDKCPFTGWLDNEKPKCTTDWHVPAMVFSESGVLYSEVLLFRFTGSALAPLTEYLTPFRDSGRPLYTSLTDITLRSRSGKDGKTWAVPDFRSRPLPAELHDAARYSELLAKAKAFLQELDPPKPVFVPLGGN